MYEMKRFVSGWAILKFKFFLYHSKARVANGKDFFSINLMKTRKKNDLQQSHFSEK